MSDVRNVSGHAQPMRLAKIPLPIAASTDEQDTGYDFVAGDVIVDAWVRVKTAEATGTTKTVDVGLLSTESGGDADGILDGVSVATAGTIKGSLANAGQTKGALLRVDESGSGALVPEPHIVGDAVSVSYSLGSDDFAELDASLYVLYFRPDDAE